MKNAILAKAGEMMIVESDKPTIQKPDDVILKVFRACVWF